MPTLMNEYGVKLDRSGYAPSIVSGHSDCQCWQCGKNGAADPLNRHEIFFGPYREKSKRLGLWVYLCHSDCHQGPEGVHSNRFFDYTLKAVAQAAAMREYSWDEAKFIQEFGRNYLCE